MKPLQKLLLLFVFSVTFLSCSKDDDPAASKFKHTGEKWTINSLEYNVVNMGLSNPANWVQTGTTTNAGAFYFDGNQGSFDIVINGDRKEDHFGFTKDGSSITIVQVDQSLSTTNFSQHIITFSGDEAGSTMTLSGTITDQGGTGQYVFTGSFVLTKE